MQASAFATREYNQKAGHGCAHRDCIAMVNRTLGESYMDMGQTERKHAKGQRTVGLTFERTGCIGFD